MSHAREADPGFEDLAKGIIVPASFGNKQLSPGDLLWSKREIAQYVMLLNRDPGVWSKRWPKLPHHVSAIMRSAAWGKKLLEWPVCATLTGSGKRDFNRVGRILYLLGVGVLDPAMVPTVQQWAPSTEFTQTKFYHNRVQQAKRAKGSI